MNELSRQNSSARVAHPDRRPVSVSAVSWQPRTSLKCEEWLRHGEQLGTIGRAAAWWIGDWVNYGNAKFGEKYSRAARITGYDVQSLMNMAYVASRFPPERRRGKLSWSHHAEAAALDTEDQDRWLRHAEALRLSVRGFREVLRTERRRSKAGRDGEQGRPQEDDGEVGGQPAAVCPSCGFDLHQSQLAR
ncbi:hypothetical protein ACIA8C_04955 [Nocardia sp. NPDC051321]|uniref:hypothetical protein n=1 Tax=Nocardia sp. NPDC051321 TaxID=3364323 RepID=UPI0037A36167